MEKRDNHTFVEERRPHFLDNLKKKEIRKKEKIMKKRRGKL